MPVFKCLSKKNFCVRTLNFRTLHPGWPFFQTPPASHSGVACMKLKICTSIHRHWPVTIARDASCTMYIVHRMLLYAVYYLNYAVEIRFWDFRFFRIFYSVEFKHLKSKNLKFSTIIFFSLFRPVIERKLQVSSWTISQLFLNIWWTNKNTKTLLLWLINKTLTFLSLPLSGPP